MGWFEEEDIFQLRVERSRNAFEKQFAKKRKTKSGGGVGGGGGIA